jgi:hypothetical protein
MLGHYRTLLEGVVAQPEKPVGTLPMMTEAERQQMLGQWNAPRDDDDDMGEDLEGLDEFSEEDLDSLITRLSPEEDAADE